MMAWHISDDNKHGGYCLYGNKNSYLGINPGIRHLVARHLRWLFNDGSNVHKIFVGTIPEIITAVTSSNNHASYMLNIRNMSLVSYVLVKHYY